LYFCAAFCWNVMCHGSSPSPRWPIARRDRRS
jgi:hypothetical protein